MSGGVDSAVSALLLKQRGFDVQGLFMSNWDSDDTYCTAAEDFQDARRVCDKLNIALHKADFSTDYRDRVFAHFLREYSAGRTPNPDVLCNREIKFGVCLDYMQRLGADWIATGHYARIEQTVNGPRLLKAQDPGKDQSYFLHGVAVESLRRALFPIGEMQKARVRDLAHEAGLPVHNKPDSTGICFIGERPFRDFLGQHIPQESGPIETDGGTVIGTHQGLAFFTLGQRSGLGLGGQRNAAEAPWYVAAKDIARNALIVVQSAGHPLLQSDWLEVDVPNWLIERPSPLSAIACGVKTRYRQADLAATVSVRADGGLRIELATAARAVTPGQYAVLYLGEQCIGGGIIERRGRVTES
jgi:tRNA-uridine 2-sulfurtransferase